MSDKDPDVNIWVNTHKCLEDFMQTLTCKKCKRKLRNPKQFLNCGHIVCAECIGSTTDCILCGIPGEVTQIYSDNCISDLLSNLDVIAREVRLPSFIASPNYESERDTGVDSDVSPLMKKPAPPKVIKKNKGTAVKGNKVSDAKTTSKEKSGVQDGLQRKVAEESLDDTKQSVCGSVISKVTTKSKPGKKRASDDCDLSVCESTFSRSTSRGNSSSVIPKDINKKNKKGETALHTACRSNNAERVQLLLDADANPNTKDNAGWTPLQEAASYGFYDVCEILLKAGASPNVTGCDNRTALHDAVQGDFVDIAKLLIKFKAKKKVYDNVGKTPRSYIKSEAMKDVFNKFEDSPEDKSSETPESSIMFETQRTPIPNNESKIILYASELKLKNRKLLNKLGIEKKLKIANHLSASVTHVIIDAETPNHVRLSFDVLITIILGKYLINSDCLNILMERDHISVDDLSVFEVNPPQLDDGPKRARESIVNQDPKLFDNCSFYFAFKSSDRIKYDDLSVTRDELVKLVTAGDGVSLTREPKPEDIQGSISPFHVAHDEQHSLHKCTHYIIYDPDETSSTRIIYNMPKLKALPLMWLIESILRFKLIDPVDLGLC
ncbi:hypothetical protein QAD02_005549 [Eretmocerus hayati]|uniref:Uncharacterized protein n=1 Tax=Eretmocerus hayati TaxID=131215 RepID=A0ACC2NT48_9HYME|nr:hypothetical protein QAD02_005549 [Eretmocerus hayati]